MVRAMPTALLRLSLGALAAALLAMPPAAGADSLVYVDAGGHVSIANPDGSAARAVTASTGWSYPSQSDDGTVAALAPSGAIAVMDQFGTVENAVPTPQSVSGDFDVTMFPRISPDGSKVAYGNLDPSDGASVYWSDSNATSLTRPSQTLGQESMGAASWVDSTHMLLTHYGETVTDTQKQLYLYTAGGGDNSETAWASDPATPTFGGGDGWEPTSFVAAMSHQVNAVAFEMDDGGGHAIVDVWEMTGSPRVLGPRGCRLTVLPNGPDALSNVGETSPSFSPDGTHFAFATDAGIWVANVPDFSDCTTMSAHLAIADGTYPYWSAADVQAPRPPAPAPTPAPAKPAPAPAPPAPTSVTPIGVHAVLSLPRRLRAHHKATFSAGKSTGRIVRYAWTFGDRGKASGKVVKHAFKRRGTYTVKLTVTDADGHTATAKRRVKVGR
jgi:PKD domain/WD40-like Beta Propeller Repeat